MNNQQEAVKLFEPVISIAGNRLPSHEIEVFRLVVVFAIGKMTEQIHTLPHDDEYESKVTVVMGKRRKLLSLLELVEGWHYTSGPGKDDVEVKIGDYVLADSDVALLRNGCDAFQRETRNSVHQKTACRLINQLTRKA